MATPDPVPPNARASFAGLRNGLEIIALILTIAVCGAMLYVILTGVSLRPVAARAARTATRPPADSVIPVDPAPIAGAQFEGDRQAKIAVIEYSDFQCPFCGRFARETLPQFEKEYVRAGKVLFVFRQFPLESIHANALRAAEAAQCAGDQGRFWELHTLLFADQKQLDAASVRDNARRAGVNVDQFDKCMDSDIATRVRADAQTGKRLVVQGTPTFFVGTVQSNGMVKIVKRLSGAITFATFKEAVDSVSTPVVASTAK